MLRRMFVIALVAIGVSACCSSRVATMRTEVRSESAAVRDSVRVEQVMVAVHDTIVETTTITIRENEQGDTVRMSVVTDRERVRDRSQLKDKSEKLIVRVDTVYVERTDSVLVKSEEFSPCERAELERRVKSDRPSAFVSALKWVFWIVIAIITLTITITITRFFGRH